MPLFGSRLSIKILSVFRIGIVTICNPTKSINHIEDEKSSPTTKKLEEIAKNTKANASAGASASKAVASSGPKVVNINVTKFFDNIEFNTTSLQESAGKIEEVILEVLSRVLVQGAAQV